MARRRYTTIKAEEQQQAKARIDALVGKKRSRKKTTKRKPSAGKATVAKYIAEQQDMQQSDDWTAAKPGHFVGLFCEAFEMVYGVKPDITGDDWRGACSAAGRTLKTQFEGDKDRFVKFIAWVWVREEGAEKWRRENNKEGRVLGWRLVFSAKFITEYKVAMMRKLE